MTDFYLYYSDAQAITASAVSNAPQNGGVIDFFGVSTDIWAIINAQPSETPHKIYLKVCVGAVGFVGAGATLAVAMQDAPDGVTYANTILQTTQPIPAVNLLPGTVLLWAPLPFFSGSVLPPNKMYRFTRMAYTVAGGPFTAGTVNALLDVY